MLTISTLAYISCPASIADDLGGLLLQSCADVTGSTVWVEKSPALARLISARMFQPSGLKLGAAKDLERALGDMRARFTPEAIAFVQACYDRRNAACDASSELTQAATETLEQMEEALRVHIYGEDDTIAPDCRYIAAIERMRAALGLPRFIEAEDAR